MGRRKKEVYVSELYATWEGNEPRYKPSQYHVIHGGKEATALAEWVGGEDYTYNNAHAEGSWRVLSDDEVMNLIFTTKNSTRRVRMFQAETLARNNFVGPLKAGEVRVLKSILEDMGKTDLVKRGWVVVERPPRNSWSRPGRSLKGPFYLFRSPREDVSAPDFIKVARLYRDGTRGFRKAALEALESKDVQKDLKILDTMDSLAALNLAFRTSIKRTEVQWSVVAAVTWLLAWITCRLLY